MNLETLKNEIERICLLHKDIKQFNFGETFDFDDGNNNSYPFAFLEIPYYITYPTNRKKTKSIRFAIDILLYTDDDRESDHTAISDAEVIGDAIVSRIDSELKELYFNNITVMSLRNFSDDDVAGMRYEFEIVTKRAFCDNNYSDQFKD